MNFLIDSNILIAFFRNTDSCHKKAIDLVKSLNDFSISEYSLAEVSTILLLKESKEVARNAMQYMINNKNITIIRLDNEELMAICNHFPHNNIKLSFIDFVLLTLAKSRNLKLLSFDKDLNTEFRRQ